MRNPELYKKLQKLYGTVRIANEGMPFITKKTMNAKGEIKWIKISGGEEYHVCCRHCGDKRYRLYINHAWGRDIETKVPSSRLVICHNEHCEGNEDRSDPFLNNPVVYLKKNLAPMLSDIRNGLVRPLAEVAGVDAAELKRIPFPKPEWSTPINQLPEHHQARQYLELERQFNVDVLSEHWKVVVADYPVKENGKDYSWLGGRIFIPCDGGGFQARCVGEHKIKYYTSDGFKKSKNLYNIQRARLSPEFCVVVEGVTDVWRVGSPGVCYYGKLLSMDQVDLLANNFKAVVLMLDKDAFIKKRTDPINRIPDGIKSYEMLRRKVRTIRAELPGAKDAAACSYETVWDYIEDRARKEGLLNIRRPEKDVTHG